MERAVGCKMVVQRIGIRDSYPHIEQLGGSIIVLTCENLLNLLKVYIFTLHTMVKLVNQPEILRVYVSMF